MSLQEVWSMRCNSAIDPMTLFIIIEIFDFPPEKCQGVIFNQEKLISLHSVASFKNWRKKEKNFTLAIKPKISTHAVLVVYTVWKNEKFTLTKKIFHENSLFCVLEMNTLVSRNFFAKKMVWVNFSNFHIVRIPSLLMVESPSSSSWILFPLMF